MLIYVWVDKQAELKGIKVEEILQNIWPRILQNSWIKWAIKWEIDSQCRQTEVELIFIKIQWAKN